MVEVKAPKPVCVEGLPGIPAITFDGRLKFGWLNRLKNWPSMRSFRRSFRREPLGDVQVAPNEIGTPQGIASQISKLTVLRRVAAHAGACARIDAGNESIRIQPLNRAGLRDARNRIVLVQRHAWNDARKLRAAAIHDAVSIRGIGRAQNRERQATVPDRRSGNLPSVQRSTKLAA